MLRFVALGAVLCMSIVPSPGVAAVESPPCPAGSGAATIEILISTPATETSHRESGSARWEFVRRDHGWVAHVVATGITTSIDVYGDGDGGGRFLFLALTGPASATVLCGIVRSEACTELESGILWWRKSQPRCFAVETPISCGATGSLTAADASGVRVSVVATSQNPVGGTCDREVSVEAESGQVPSLALTSERLRTDLR